MFKQQAVLILILASSATYGDVIHADTSCNEPIGLAKIIEVAIDGCSNTSPSDPCEIPLGSQASGYARVLSNFMSENMTCEITATIGAVNLPFPGGCPNKHVCSDLSYSNIPPPCPIIRGEEFIYTIMIEILPEYPQAEIIGTWKVMDWEYDVDLFCFAVPIKLVG